MRELAKELLTRCGRAARANVGPGLALQALALGVVGSYYWWSGSAGFFEGVAGLKDRFGYWYSAVTTCIFGGLVPYVYLVAAGRVAAGRRLGVGLFFGLFWMWKGLEVDALYRGQAWLFGEGADWATVAWKVAFDQLVFCPLWSAPMTALAYRWMDCGFEWGRLRGSLSRRFFVVEIPAVLVAIWLVWVPGTAAIYSLPSDLQLPLFTLVLCFYVLLVSALDRGGQGVERG